MMWYETASKAAHNTSANFNGRLYHSRLVILGTHPQVATDDQMMNLAMAQVMNPVMAPTMQKMSWIRHVHVVVSLLHEDFCHDEFLLREFLIFYTVFRNLNRLFSF